MSLRAYGFRVESLLSTSQPFIPIAMQFIRDSKLDLPSNESEYNRPELDQPVDQGMLEFYREDLTARKTRWHDGGIAGTLTNEDFTSIAGMTIPRSFEVRIYLTPRVLFRQYNGTITNVATAEADGQDQNERKFLSKTFQPPILSKSVITDSRFRFRDATREIDNIKYDLVPGKHWLPTNSEYLQERFKHFLDTPSLSARHKFSIWPKYIKRNLIIGFMLFATFALLLLIFRFFRRTSNKKT